MDQTHHVRPTNSEGDVNLELSVATSSKPPACKVSWEFAAKYVDSIYYSFDAQSKLAYHTNTNKDAVLIVAAKNIPQREQRVIEGQVCNSNINKYLFLGQIIRNIYFGYLIFRAKEETAPLAK